jgi:DMSO/TMAO reductase YedYZ molybdopterin-dependent catalytic subunit
VNKRSYLNIGLMILLLAGLTACAQAATEEAPPPEEPAVTALTMTGSVDNPTDWTMAELEAMESISVETTNKSGETVQNTGVKLLSLLEQAGLQEGASQLTFVGSDGYEGQADVAEILACEDCIVAFSEDGTLAMVLPDFSGKAQVKGVVEIRAE